MKSIYEYLERRGFIADRPIDLTEAPCFSGRIRIGDYDLALELRFNKGKFDYPTAHLTEWPHDKALRVAFGFRHINANGLVCYVDDSRTWWDSTMAVRLVAGALESIEKLLTENLNGATGEEEIARDFGGYWDEQRRLYAANKLSVGQKYNHVCGTETEREWLVAHNASPWFTDKCSQTFAHWVVLELKWPAADLDPETWPPETLLAALKWLEHNSPNSITNLVQIIKRDLYPSGKGRQGSYSQDIGVVILWPNPDGKTEIGCGFRFKMPELAAKSIAHGRLKQAKTYMMSSQEQLTRYKIEQADELYIQTRNTPGESPLLTGKKVILIGAGAIGGYMAKLLCSYGAGSGKGVLHIIDKDVLKVENIGRHILGYQYVDKLKAPAVKEFLENDFPYLTIKAHPESLTDCWKLFTNDSIIVDATGCQTVSVAIPDYLTSANLKPLVLHTWIHGHGGATVAFINDRTDKRSACFRCLWKLENNTYKPRFALSHDPDEDSPVFVGCHQSYHAYAPTVSMMAATQGMNLLSEYLRGVQAHTLRFQIVRPDICQNRPDTTPSRNCPLCDVS